MSRSDPFSIRAFEPHEIALSTTASAAVVTGFLALLVFAGKNKTHVKAVEAPPEKLVPMKVTPVLDELPLLKLGGKKRAKLPDMWKKNPPVQAKRPAYPNKTGVNGSPQPAGGGSN